MKLVLAATKGPHKGETFDLRGHDTFVVGRSDGAGVRLPLKDGALSRVHFLIEVNPPACRLIDMASTNGTFVNGRRVSTTDLRHGDLIRCGKTVLKVGFQPDDPVPDTREVPIQSGPISPEMLSTISYEGPVPDTLPALPGLTLEGELGRGGMGVVYRARTASGEAVAVKTISPNAIGSESVVPRFLREASILRRLAHPGIVKFREIGHRKGLLYFLMDLIPGRDADRLVKEEGPLAIPRAVEIASQVLDALAFAHDLGFVHRDVKPKNVLITTESGRDVVHLADFGLARLYHDSPMSGLSFVGEIAGTLGYMPPEQITHFRDSRPLSDQYAAGATLYFLLTGTTNFDLPKSVQKQLAMILRDEDPIPINIRRPEIPAPLAAAIHRSLSPDPADRFPDVRAMLTALAPFRG
ncbi:MAG: stkP 4 [Planctomycetota bacterium]|nr:stkP 4 [Planctomycetota bacterium]